MLVQKHVTVAGSFAKPNEDLFDKSIIKILNEGQKVPGDYGVRDVFKIITENGEKVLSFNQTSMNNLIDAFGEDTSKWKGQEVKVWLINQMVSGKLRNIVYLTAPSWVMSTTGEFIASIDTASEKVAGVSSDEESLPELEGEEIPF
jgi:hypothetical protein